MRWQPGDRTGGRRRGRSSSWNLGTGRGRGGGRGEEAEGARGADGAEELLADAGEVHAAALDQKQGQEDEGPGRRLEELAAAAATEEGGG